jgi:Ca2+/Na+ antiporter
MRGRLVADAVPSICSVCVSLLLLSCSSAKVLNSTFFLFNILAWICCCVSFGQHAHEPRQQRHHHHHHRGAAFMESVMLRVLFLLFFLFF